MLPATLCVHPLHPDTASFFYIVFFFGTLRRVEGEGKSRMRPSSVCTAGRESREVLRAELGSTAAPVTSSTTRSCVLRSAARLLNCVNLGCGQFCITQASVKETAASLRGGQQHRAVLPMGLNRTDQDWHHEQWIHAQFVESGSTRRDKRRQRSAQQARSRTRRRCES